MVALQEVTARTLPMWAAELERAGFLGQDGSDGELAAGPRTAAARGADRRARAVDGLDPPAVPWPERLLCCVLGDVEIVNLPRRSRPRRSSRRCGPRRWPRTWPLRLPARVRCCAARPQPPRRGSPTATYSPSRTASGRLGPNGERWIAPRRARHDLRERAGSMPFEPSTATASVRRAGVSTDRAAGAFGHPGTRSPVPWRARTPDGIRPERPRRWWRTWRSPEQWCRLSPLQSR